MAMGKKDILQKLVSGDLVVSPLSQLHPQIAGIQLSLGSKLARMKPGTKIRPAKGIAPKWQVFEIDPENGFELEPGGFLLGHTFEKLAIPRDVLAFIDGRSTIARCGVTPHQAAMAIWPGHGKGESGPRSVTLELKNQGELPVVLDIGMFIANMTFHQLDTPVDVDYDRMKSSKYGEDAAIMLPKFNGEVLTEESYVKDASELLGV